MKLHGSIIAVEALDAADRAAMFEIMDRIYANVRREAFDRDLAGKHWVIRLDDPATGRLVGFSTQQLCRVEIAGAPVEALFSGDTVVDRAHWGDTALAGTWGNFALKLIDQPDRKAPFYWFLISKGFRTYRYLPLFFRRFYPRHDAASPSELIPVVDALAHCVAPAAYDPATQIIRAGRDKEYVRPGYNDAVPRSSGDPHVRYFLQRNPGFSRGDELCCLAPLSRENFTPLAWRMIRAAPSAVCEA